MAADSEYLFVRAEAVLSDASAADLPSLALAEYACDEIGKVLQFIDPSAEPGASDRLLALQTLGIVATRSLRASMALIRLGYASEASVFHRRLSEAQQRVLRVLDPINGEQRARDWLSGHDSTARKVSGLSAKTWAAVSHNAHADYRAVTSHHAGRRTIPLAPATAKQLTKRQTTQKAHKSDPMFANGRGGVIDACNFRSKVFNPASERAGVPWATPHSLRHGMASLMADNGYTAAQIAQHLGHADGGVLAQRTYIHPASVDVSFLDDVLGG